jgi:hypothetical protein
MKQQTKDKIEGYVEEYIRCKNDFNYYCSHYVYLELPGGDIIYKPYKKQVEVVDLINHDHYCLILKSRQVGISTTIQAYSSWIAVFHSNSRIGILSRDGTESTNFARAVRGMIEKLPAWMKPKGGREDGCFHKKSEQSFILANNSHVIASTVNPQKPENTFRGTAITTLIIDEAAFIARISDAWVGLVSSTATAQKNARKLNIPYATIIISTPNKTTGTGSWYYSKYVSAMSGDGLFKPFIIYWKDIEELANDPFWYKNQCELFDGDQRKIEQELELKFLPTGGSFFDEQTCLKLQEGCIDPIETFKLFEGEIWKFQDPIPGKYYIMGVDTAPEFGEDKSAITIWDYETLEQTWEYQTKCKVIDFVKVVKYAASQYPGSIVIENNSYGNQVTEELSNSEFVGMVYKEKRGENKWVYGLSNNAKTRPLMLDALYSYVTQFPNMVKSKRTALELIGLVDKKGRVEADSGCHDDLALTLAFCMHVRKYDPPMLLDVNKTTQNAFMDILAMNDDTENKFKDSSSIMKHVKENVFKPEDSLVNTLELFYR